MKKFLDFPVEIQQHAQEMAVAVNGGAWPDDYKAESIQIGWALKVQWALERFGDNK